MKHCTVSSLVGVVLLLALGCGQSQDVGNASSGSDPDKAAALLAPSWELTDASGRTVGVGGARERPVVLLFWATWCPYCKQLMPHLQSLVDEYDGEIEVLALNVFEDADPAAFMSEYGYAFRLVPEADGVAKLYGVKGTPGLFLVDRHGQVRFDLSRLEADKAIPEQIKRWQKAARLAPWWAAKLRQAIDQLE